MNFDRDYYYVKYENNNTLFNEIQNKKIDLIKNNQIYSHLTENSEYFYLILNDTDLIGFFSLNIKKKYVIISSLYVCKEYRKKGIATEIINDVIFAVKYNIKFHIHCIIVNSYAESALFFLKRGFDFCKLNKKLNYKKRNIILMKKHF